MNKKINFKKLLVFIFWIILINIFWLPNIYADPPLPTPVGRVVWVKGNLKATMPNKEQRVLQKTSLIYLQDTLTTDSNTEAQIVFTDNTLMTFKAGTKFYVDQYDFNPKATKKGSVGKYIMTLIEGGFRTITGWISKTNPNDYQVHTPVATIGVRGTDYAAYYENGEMLVNYYQGSPCVTNKGGTLCLSEKTPYARVPSATAKPVPLTQQPSIFKEKLTIIQAKIAPFTAPIPRGGVINSFCITQ